VKIKRRDDVPPVETSDYAGVVKQIVIGPSDGSDEIVLRYFTVAAGGTTPRHSHAFPHLVKVEAGRGLAVNAGGDKTPITGGDYVFVESNEVHNFENAGEDAFEFICIVPARGESPA
jgi:quercetin dioxygenase-like cupin family protein